MDWSPYDPALHVDPYPLYRQLRDESPVNYSETLSFWTLSRYADVEHALRQPEVFVSGQGIAVGLDVEDAATTNQVPLLIMMDGDDHKQLRALVSGSFAPRRVSGLEPMIRKVTQELLDDLANRDAPDLVKDIDNPLPTIVIDELLGVPSSDREQFKHWSNAIVQFDPAKPDGIHPGATSGPAVELAQYFMRIIEERRQQPRDDLLSRLIATNVDGRKLTDGELIGFGFLLLVAGHETTTNLISNTLVLLEDDRDTRRRLVADPSLMTRAVEEFLRFDAPVQGLARTTTQDVTLHGTTIPAGEKVLLLFASANRDERKFEAPDRFDVTRWPNEHISFGFGKHFCLGSGLARLEARVAFEEILARIPDYALTGGPIERLSSGPIRGVLRLPAALGL
jgi:cytochrome P450